MCNSISEFFYKTILAAIPNFRNAVFAFGYGDKNFVSKTNTLFHIVIFSLPYAAVIFAFCTFEWKKNQ